MTSSSVRIVRSVRTSALLARTDVTRQAERRAYALDPYTAERVYPLLAPYVVAGIAVA